MILPEFELHQPNSVDEAVAIAERLGDDFEYVAGGTDLLQNYKNRLNPKGNLISLVGIDGLRTIEPDRIGALVTLHEIETSDVCQEHYPGIVDAASQIASPLVRRTATFGGNLVIDTRCFFLNQTEFWRASKGYCMKAEGDVCLVVPQKEICWATHSGDIAPVLMALNATYHLTGPEGERAVPADEFYCHDGIKRNVRKPGELITHVTFPDKARTLRSGYRKLRVRSSYDYPLVGVAATLELDGREVTSLRVVLNAVHTHPIAQDEITSEYLGRELTDEAIAEMADRIRDGSRPLRNVSLSPRYRKKMVGVFTRRLLTELRGA